MVGDHMEFESANAGESAAKSISEVKKSKASFKKVFIQSIPN